MSSLHPVVPSTRKSHYVAIAEQFLENCAMLSTHTSSLWITEPNNTSMGPLPAIPGGQSLLETVLNGSGCNSGVRAGSDGGGGGAARCCLVCQVWAAL
jgi:hypothetical protein